MAFLFVYGTLRKDTSHPMSEWVNKHARYVGIGKVKGLLYQISWYPAFVKSNNSQYFVVGDLYEIDEKNIRHFFTKLDEYEGDEYDRLLIEVETDNVNRMAFIYVFNKSVDGFKRIVSGDFLLGS